MSDTENVDNGNSVGIVETEKPTATLQSESEGVTVGGAGPTLGNGHDPSDEPMDSYKGEKNEKGEMHGFGVYTYASGDVYTGTFANDMMDGKGKFTCQNTDEYIGEFKNDMKHGEGKYCWNDGEVYEGFWKEDSMDGQGKMTYANGDFYEGSFSDNRRHGIGEMHYKESGNVYKGKNLVVF